MRSQVIRCHKTLIAVGAMVWIYATVPIFVLFQVTLCRTAFVAYGADKQPLLVVLQ